MVLITLISCQTYCKVHSLFETGRLRPLHLNLDTFVRYFYLSALNNLMVIINLIMAALKIHIVQSKVNLKFNVKCNWQNKLVYERNF